MKNLPKLTVFMLAALAAALVLASGQSQQPSPATVKTPDSRVWNQGYWLEMARRGFVPVAPDVPVPEAVRGSSRILVPGLLEVDSPDVPVTTEADTTQSENSIFIHPLDTNKVLNSNNSTNWPFSTLYGASRFFSADGGTTWGGSKQGPVGNNSGDPATAIGLNGRYYMGFVASSYDQAIAYSDDEGSTWSLVQAAGGGYVLDKNHLWIDNSAASAYEGNLYDAWTNFQSGANDGDIELRRSTTDGTSWSSSLNISAAVSAGSHNQGVNLQTGPNGEVYAVWAIYDSWPSDETALGFAKSIDGGATFAPATRIISGIRGIRTSGTSKNQRVNSFPCMAADTSDGPDSGSLYVVWSNIGVPGVNQGPDIDIYMIKSADGGATWSQPARVNQDPTGLGNEHYFPWITCDPVTGALCAVFYDDRNVSSTQCEVYAAVSHNGGLSWSDFKISDVAFTPAPIPGLASGYFGDYIGVSARGGKVYPVWTDNRDGRAMAYVSPFYLGMPPIPDLKINGEDDPPNIHASDVVTVTISLDPGEHGGEYADWWVYVKKNSANTWYCRWNGGDPKWTKSGVPLRFAGAPLQAVNGVALFGPHTMKPGYYVFTFSVDDKNGIKEDTYRDIVSVLIQP